MSIHISFRETALLDDNGKPLSSSHSFNALVYDDQSDDEVELSFPSFADMKDSLSPSRVLLTLAASELGDTYWAYKQASEEDVTINGTVYSSDMIYQPTDEEIEEAQSK